MGQARVHRSPVLTSADLELFKPLLKAYTLGYLTSTLPRLPATIKYIRQSQEPFENRVKALKSVLTGAVGINRFPTACAVIVGGTTLLPHVLRKLLLWLSQCVTPQTLLHALNALNRRIRFICAFASAWYAFSLLNEDEGWARKRARSRASLMRPMFDFPNTHHPPPPGYQMRYAGKTVDFTLFAFCRAVDVLAISGWTSTRELQGHPENIAPRISRLLQRVADPWVFATSSAIIMWSWFYSPERLPKTYNQWISKVAHIDHRLINALRLARQGEFVYGQKGSPDAGLPGLCKELNLPPKWGDPSTTVPIPCELYHCGAGKNCEVHAATRFLKTFNFAMRLYLPLQLVGLLRFSSLSPRRLLNLIKDAARSSSFLAGFVSLFYYAVCLARTRLGPKLFSSSTVTPQMWDSGLCVLAGCLACGWSLLLEKQGRQQEIAFFVAPRALATLLPRVYDKQYQRREKLVFASSVAVVMTATQSKHHRVRGMLGRVLEGVLR